MWNYENLKDKSLPELEEIKKEENEKLVQLRKEKDVLISNIVQLQGMIGSEKEMTDFEKAKHVICDFINSNKCLVEHKNIKLTHGEAIKLSDESPLSFDEIKSAFSLYIPEEVNKNDYNQ